MADTAKIDPRWAWEPYQPSVKEPWNVARVGHLYRRAGFGANLAESVGAGRTARGASGAGEGPAPSAPGRMEGTTRLRSAAEIAVERLSPDPNQPRTEFEPESITRLAASLNTHGQLQPISVRWSDEAGKYVIVTGERRWRAAVLAGKPTVAAVILDGDGAR